MAAPTQGIGLEERDSILPTPNIPTKGPGIFGPDYSVADNVPLPGEVGVRDGDDFDSVLGAVKGAAYYIDLIGFGESSSFMTRGMGVKPLGVNVWMKSGLKCSNGADAWQYIEGIPTGNAVGKKLADGLKSAGLPGLRGIAPGILEDAEEALNPIPVMGAIFGSQYPLCSLESKRVGDQDNNIQNSATGNYYVENHETVEMVNGTPFQKRWVQTGSLTQSQWEKAPKTHCPDGSKKSDHRVGDCKLEIIGRSEGFVGDSWKAAALAAVAIVGIAIIVKMRR